MVTMADRITDLYSEQPHSHLHDTESVEGHALRGFICML